MRKIKYTKTTSLCQTFNDKLEPINFATTGRVKRVKSQDKARPEKVVHKDFKPTNGL